MDLSYDNYWQRSKSARLQKLKMLVTRLITPSVGDLTLEDKEDIEG